MANYYTFKIKKDKFELEVNSDDKKFVFSQYEKLLKEINGQPKEPEKAAKEEKVKKEEKPEPMPEVKPEKEVKKEKEEVKEVKEIKETTKTEEPEKIPDKKPETTEIKEEVKKEEKPEPPKPDPDEELDKFLYRKNFEPAKPDKTAEFKDVIQEKIQEQEEEKVQEVEEPVAEPEPTPEPEPPPEPEPVKDEPEEKKSNVYDILEEKLASLPEEEKNRLNLKKNEEKETQLSLKFSNLDELIEQKTPQTKLDYLLVTSYYLQEKASTDKYSLKQINSLVIPRIKEPIDHSVIHEAVAQEYLIVVPDETETADITEYKITDQGIKYILNEL